MDVTTSLVSQYQDQLQRECCLDGMRNTPLSYTCERRAEYISDGAECAAAFLHCCKEMETQRAERKEDSLILARSEEDDSYMDSNDIVSHTLPERICVGGPLEVIVRKEFFIDLRLPYSAVRGEQLEIKAILHNYSPFLSP
ncbi:hypothetical protein PFLUV_G00092390 [Perca fluviatilis]|uniref:Anaphylatoxin-like domain-containing protein n=1 Tax=Perca fluviatilis TaxID=8168 RepID=A0A6A5FB06_PERFL|nr:hypothetical protein PFLUV_G00092390 [Perca fluviatilis]